MHRLTEPASEEAVLHCIPLGQDLPALQSSTHMSVGSLSSRPVAQRGSAVPSGAAKHWQALVHAREHTPTLFSPSTRQVGGSSAPQTTSPLPRQSS
jgi:hypothetical protein